MQIEGMQREASATYPQQTTAKYTCSIESKVIVSPSEVVSSRTSCGRDGGNRYHQSRTRIIESCNLEPQLAKFRA